MATIDLYKDIDFNLKENKPEFATNDDFKKILKDTCSKKAKEDSIAKLKKPTLSLSFDSAIIVMGLPKVEREKSKLLIALFEKKLLPKFNVVLRSIELEFDDQGQTTGTAILQFDDPEKAIEAATGLNNVILPPNFTLTALTFKDFEDVLEEQNKKNMTILAQEELADFHKKNLGVQKLELAVSFNNSQEFKIGSFDSLKKNITIGEGVIAGFTPKDIKFSDSGNYLIVMLDNKFEIFGGPSMELLTSFLHKGVRSVRFSPDEKYIMSYNGTVNENKNSENLIIWDLFTGQRLRIFKITHKDQFEGFRFSNSSNFFSGIIEVNEKKLFCVYELPKCALTVDPVSQKRCQFDVANPLRCAWAPFSDHILVLSGGEEAPKSEIAIYNANTRARTGWISVTFNVISGEVFWSQDENFIIVKMNAKIKRKLETIIHIGTINLDKRTSSVSILDSIKKAETPEIVVAPNANFFVLFTQVKERYNLEVFLVEKIGDNFKAKSLYLVPKQNLSKAYFCPFSKFMILGDGRSAWFTDFKMIKGRYEFKLIREIESSGSHGRIHWSPCGRFVAFVKEAGENLEASVYDCYGRAARTEVFKEARHFNWRLFDFGKNLRIAKEQKKEIKAEVIANYDALVLEDEKVVDIHKANLKAARIKRMDEFKDYLERKRKVWEASAKSRVQMVGYDETEIQEPVVMTRVNKEEVIEEKAV